MARRAGPSSIIRAFWGGGTDLDRPRVVLVHPGALPATCYHQLAAAMLPGADLFVVDLEQIPEYWEAALRGGHAPITIAELATRVDDALWDHGLLGPPWVLAGWSFGGVIAHALSAALAEDERPEALLLLDSIAPVPEYTTTDDELDAAMVLRWFAMYLAAKRGRPVPVAWRRLASADLETGLGIVLDAAIAGGALRPGTPLAGLVKVFRSYTDGLLRNNRLATGYQAAPTAVPSWLIRPKHGLLDTADPLGWQSLTTELTTRSCDGDHYSMLRDRAAVRSIADAATRSLHTSRLASECLSWNSA